MQQISISGKRIIAIYTAWWLFWIMIQTYVLYKAGLSIEVSLIDATVSNGLLALIGFALTNTLRFYQPGTKNGLYRIGFCIIYTWLYITALHWILVALYPADSNYIKILSSSMPARFMFSFLMVVFMMFIGWLWFYMKEMEENKNRKTEAEKLLKEVELSTLRQQLQPHFLFNSLNSISALVGYKPEEARKMIQHLSDFLRGTLKKDEQQLVLLSEEIQHLQLYLEIEKVRFGHRLSTIVEHDSESLNLKLPSLLLQPIVENAIKFGLYDTTGDITIRIKARVDEQQLIIQVENPFDATTAMPKQGAGFGLNSVQRRLYLLYARKDLLLTEQKENKFITTVKIPQA